MSAALAAAADTSATIAACRSCSACCTFCKCASIAMSGLLARAARASSINNFAILASGRRSALASRSSRSRVSPPSLTVTLPLSLSDACAAIAAIARQQRQHRGLIAATHRPSNKPPSSPAQKKSPANETELNTQNKVHGLVYLRGTTGPQRGTTESPVTCRWRG